jgi:hypothetical protein
MPHDPTRLVSRRKVQIIVADPAPNGCNVWRWPSFAHIPETGDQFLVLTPTIFPGSFLSTQVHTSAATLLANLTLGSTIPLIESYLHCNKLTSSVRRSSTQFDCKTSTNVPEAKLKFPAVKA